MKKIFKKILLIVLLIYALGFVLTFGDEEAENIVETPVPVEATLIKISDFHGTYDMEHSWRDTWLPSEVDDSCVSSSKLNQSPVTPGAKRNLEIIFNKDFESINDEDILNLKILSFIKTYPNSLSFKNSPTPNLESYEGLEYLTCLQYLDLNKQDWGRDIRFLSNLTNLRYLDLSLGHYSIKRIEVLYTLKNLETLILPFKFLELDKLINIPSLKRVAANYSLTCQEDVFSKMENLEVVLLYWSDIQMQENLLNREDSFTISKSPSGEYLELIVPGGPTAFMTDDVVYTGNPSGIHSREYMMNVMQNIYDVVDDQYEVVIFVGNQLESSVSYLGLTGFISNDEPGLGVPIWSSASCYGSNENLRGHITFPSSSALYDVGVTVNGIPFVNGPLLHEILHLWGGADLIPYFQQDDGVFGMGHWGYSSGGILGGFNPDSLNQIEDNVYQVGWFGTVGNGLTWNMGNAEKYIMGILPPEQFEDIISFVDLKKELDILCKNNIEKWYEQLSVSVCIEPGKILKYTLSDITDVFGKVDYIGSRSIDVLVVYVSEEKVTDAQWKILDEALGWHIESSNVDDGSNNIYEASDGLLKLSFPKP